jgi:hypothetical protein
MLRSDSRRHSPVSSVKMSQSTSELSTQDMQSFMPHASVSPWQNRHVLWQVLHMLCDEQPSTLPGHVERNTSAAVAV